MAADLGLMSLTQLQKLAQSHHQSGKKENPSSTGADQSRMWNPKQQAEAQEDDDSWEVRAFAEDTGNVMGTTWPPRSYTCTFCRREFRSAQALGGHMNVHRRDRARLHQTTTMPTPPPGTHSSNYSSSSSSSSSSTLIIPTQEFITNGGGLCLLYQLPPNPNAGLFAPTTINSCLDSPSTLLSIAPYPRISPCCPPSSFNFPPASPQAPFPLCPSSSNNCGGREDDDNESNNYNAAAMDELDLELRLGHRSSPS